VALSLSLVTIAVAGLACAGDDDDSETEAAERARIEAFVQQRAAAWNAGDAEGLATLYTDGGLASLAGDPALGTREARIAAISELIGTEQIDSAIVSVETDGDTSVVLTDDASGATVRHRRLVLVPDGGSYLVDLDEPVEETPMQ
jgi:uncharacterized protein (TIGR02246 family)